MHHEITSHVIDAIVTHHTEIEPAWCRAVLDATAVVLDVCGAWTRVAWGWPGRISLVENGVLVAEHALICD